MINIKNRKKQINKIRDEYGTNPYFGILEQLYYKNTIKRITSITKLLKKIKLKKDGSVDKRTNKQIEKFIKPFKVVQEPELLGSRTIKIDIVNIIEEGYNVITHNIEITKLKKDIKKDKKNKKKNLLYIHEVKFYDDNNEEINKVIEIEEDGQSVQLDFKNRKWESKTADKSYIEKISSNMMVTTEGEYLWLPEALVTYVDNNYYTIITTRVYDEHKTQNIKLNQEFQADDDGVCVYNNFVQYFSSKPNNKNAKAIYNKLMKPENIKKYRKSYKKDELKEICDFCNSSLYIRDLVNGKKNDININNEYARFKIEMVNTKYNHLDLLISDNEIIEVTEEEYNKIKNDVTFYVEKYGYLQTLDAIYKVRETKFKQLSNKWKKENKINEKYIFEDSDEFKLINTYDYKLHSFFNDFDVKDDLYKEVDLIQSYYNNLDKEKNKNFCGMPTGAFISAKCNKGFNITHFDELLKNNLIGFFQVKIKNIWSKKAHFDKLNFKIGSIYTLTTPQINLLKEYIEFKFLSYSYATSENINFETKLDDGYNFLDKHDGVKNYCRQFGMMLCDAMPIKITIKPLKMDEEYYNIIYDDNYNVYNIDGILHITYKNEKFKSYKHLGYFIHSYTRTNIIEQLLKMDINDVFGVKLDSIVYKKDSKFEYDSENFKIKNGKIQSLLKNCINNENVKICNDLDFGTSSFQTDISDKTDVTTSTYYINYFSESEKIDLKYSFLHNDNIHHMIMKRIIFIAGMGGSGKTYSLLKDGLNRSNTCYVSSCWNLMNGMRETYPDIKAYSVPNLTGKCNGQAVEKIYDPNIKNIVIDELTLLNKNDINEIIKNYPNCFIFLVGDIDKDGFYYQCSLPKTPVFNPSKYDGELQYIKYTQNFRHTEEMTQEMQLLRNKMKKYSSSPFKLTKIFKFVKEKFSSCFVSKEKIKYNDCDVGVTACDDFKRGNKLSNYFIDNGAKPKYFIKNTFRKSNQLRGAELDGKPDHKNYEMKLFKTIHSFQGLDLDHNNKIIINIDKNFDYNLLYTAISRARRLDQVNIIN